MQVDETGHHIVHQCFRCGVVIEIAKPAKPENGQRSGRLFG